MQECWADEGPPVATWAAAYFKFKPAKRRKKEKPKRAAEAAQELLALFRS